MITISYIVEYEIILKGIEPFTTVSTKIGNFLKELVNSGQITGYTWKIKN